MNILITGITGFLGKNFVNYLITNNIDCKIIGTAHSESKLSYFKKIFPDIKIYVMELSSDNFSEDIDLIIKIHKINYILHTAAMKHVDICQENPIKTLQVNTIATEKLIKVSQKNNINNLIALSTDKSNFPCNIYGMSKYLMQELILKNNYSVYQGVNFFWSDGSVIDIWYHQYVKKQPLTVRNVNHIRYFTTIEYVCEQIYKNLDKKGQILTPEHVYVIKLKDLLKAFKEYFNYHDVKNIPLYEFEKEIEVINHDIKKKIKLKKIGIKELIDKKNIV